MGTVNDMRRQIKGIGNATEQRRENAARQLGLSTGGQQSAPSNTARPVSSAIDHSRKPQVQAKATPAPRLKKAAAAPKTSKPRLGPQQKAEVAKTGTSPATGEKNTAKVMRGRRDPFQTVIRAEPVGVQCATGKRCLIVDKMDLKGIVRYQNGMIAIVENQQRRTYFLHENDPVFNGHVVKINPDSIIFRETVTDRVGRQSTREIVKRISRPAV